MKPNVLVILCDQLRADFLGCYGFKEINTPNIDGLLEDGVLFNHATTASPVCAPGRACMMTGRNVSDHNVWTNDVEFRKNIEFLPQRMNDNNYYSFAIGKLHHFPGKDTKGFNFSLQMEEDRLGKEDDYYKWLKKKHPEITSVFNANEKGQFLYGENEYYENWICDNGIEQIESNKDKSFFGWISFQGPHTPIDPLQEAKHKDIKLKPQKPDFIPPCEVARYRRGANKLFSYEEELEYRNGYCKLIEEIDKQIGKLIRVLKENDLYRKTVIIFSADHGDLCGDYSMRQKGPFLYKAQLEIPFIIANHPKLPKNTISDMLVSNIDIGSTVLELVGDNKPLGYSKSISQMYNNKNLQREYTYSEFADSIRIISGKKYRMAYYPFTKECELVDIEDETKDLSQDEKYLNIKNNMLMEIIDNMVLSKGVHIEAQDLTPKVQAGIEKLWPEFRDEIPLCFPLSSVKHIESLKENGLDCHYLDFCKNKKILKSYGKFWDK